MLALQERGYGLTFVVEAINPVDGGAFMVAAQHEEVVRKLAFVREHESHGLYALAAAVDIIAATR